MGTTQLHTMVLIPVQRTCTLYCHAQYAGSSDLSGAEEAAFQWSGHRLMRSGRMLPLKFFDLRRSEVNSRAF